MNPVSTHIAVGTGFMVGEPMGMAVGAEDGFSMVLTYTLPVLDPAYNVVKKMKEKEEGEKGRGGGGRGRKRGRRRKRGKEIKGKRKKK